ncbi:hypothetical protein GDO86_002063 [Hymenochirus boettgeri]|uniref:FAM234A/B beta-propeller domain-containing protein n=1 Tax=Hymenochirus boettgeri TaxID=247094 RepID=A0A8T2KGC1_9PIPI|nr:hypothetical protein GDO86_002063 [Hymenochirus boettgeri]
MQNGKGTREISLDQGSDVEGVSKRLHYPVVTKQDSISPSSGLDLDLKATPSVLSYIRTSVFLLTVVVSMIMVLICAFLIPCPHSEQHHFWTLSIGQEAGMLSPLELFDVDMDSVSDILVSFSSMKNMSQGVLRHHLSVAAISGMNNSILWSSRVQEDIRSIKCGQLIVDSKQNYTCLLSGSSRLLQLVKASSGKTIWTSSIQLSSGTIAGPAVVLPDINGDHIFDLLVLTVGDQQPNLGFQLVSGLSGQLLGETVKYRSTIKGKLLGPHVHYTTLGAIYILFGYGNIQAVSLRDIYNQARMGGSLPKVLQKKQPEWEKQREVNMSQVISVYSSGVEFLQTIPVLDSNCSDLLITTNDGLTLLRGQDLEKRWSITLRNLHSQPQPGYFNADGSLDFLLQVKSNSSSKRVLIIDGTTGVSLWEWEVPWHGKEADAASTPTSDGKSAFVFWGDRSTPSISTVMQTSGIRALNTEAAMNTEVKSQWNRHLFMLHPSYPGVILDLFNVSTTVVQMAVGVKELEKNAFIAILTADREKGTSDNMPQILTVNKLDLRWAISHSHALSLGNTNMRPKVEDVKKILSRLKFSKIIPKL